MAHLPEAHPIPEQPSMRDLHPATCASCGHSVLAHKRGKCMACMVNCGCIRGPVEKQMMLPLEGER